MPTLEGTKQIKATPEHLFWFSQDYENRVAWDKYLRIARLEGGAKVAGLG